MPWLNRSQPSFRSDKRGHDGSDLARDGAVSGDREVNSIRLESVAVPQRQLDDGHP